MDIIANMLEIAKEGSIKTQIMYKANLSFTQLNDYIDFLLNNDLIKQTGSEGKEFYVITAKGLDFLQVHKELVQLLKA